MFLTVLVKKMSTTNTVLCLEGSLRVVDPRMNDLGIARTGGHSKGGLLLQQHHFATLLGQACCDGEAHHTRSNDSALHMHVRHGRASLDQVPGLYEDGAAFPAKRLVHAHVRASNP